MAWLTVAIGAAAALVALAQTMVAVGARRDAQASAATAEAASQASGEHLRAIVELMRPPVWTAEHRPDQRSFQFRNTSGRALTQAEIHAAGHHIPLGTMGPGEATWAVDLSQLPVGYEVTISADETGTVAVPLPSGTGAAR